MDDLQARLERVSRGRAVSVRFDSQDFIFAYDYHASYDPERDAFDVVLRRGGRFEGAYRCLGRWIEWKAERLDGIDAAPAGYADLRREMLYWGLEKIYEQFRSDLDAAIGEKVSWLRRARPNEGVVGDITVEVRERSLVGLLAYLDRIDAEVRRGVLSPAAVELWKEIGLDVFTEHIGAASPTLPWAFFPDGCKEELFGRYTSAVEGAGSAGRGVPSWAERVWDHFASSGFASYTTPEGFNAVSARFCCLGLIYRRFVNLVQGNLSYDSASFFEHAWAVLPLIRGGEELDEDRFRLLAVEEYAGVASRLFSAFPDEAELYEALRHTIPEHSNVFATFDELIERERRGVGDEDEMYRNDMQALGWVCDGMPLEL